MICSSNVNVNITLQINEVFQITGFRVKTVAEAFRRFSGQGLEVCLNSRTTVVPSPTLVPPIPFNFLDIEHINEQAAGSFVGNCLTYFSLYYILVLIDVVVIRFHGYRLRM
jgi:hypothetical protein